MFMSVLDDIPPERREPFLAHLRRQGLMWTSQRSGLHRFCTEDVACYLPALDVAGKRCLTVAGSGDQAVNLLMAGAREVVAFDSVAEAGLMLDLKTAALVASDGDPRRFRGDFDEWLSPDGFERIRRDLGFDAGHHFEKVAPLAHDSGHAAFRPFQVTGLNPYLVSDATFAAARTAVGDARREGRMRFVHTDVRGLPHVPGIGTFDAIVLSNVVGTVVDVLSGGLRQVPDRTHGCEGVDEDWLVACVRAIVGPVAAMLRPGGAMMADYVFCVPSEHDEDDGGDDGWERRPSLSDARARAAAFAPPPGFTMQEIRTESRNGEAGGDDVAVILRRVAA